MALSRVDIKYLLENRKHLHIAFLSIARVLILYNHIIPFIENK